MSIKEALNQLHDELDPKDCTLVAVSKTKPNEMVLEAYETGHLDFGENKIQDLVAKYDQLPKDIRWHMIGHVQTNKVKYMAPFVHLIHAIDSLKLLREVNKQASKHDRVIPCLLQIHIAEESTKFGFSREEVMDLLKPENLTPLEQVRVEGLMGMATFTDDQEKIRREFRSLKNLFDELKAAPPLPNLQMKTLSMGMSGDYRIALEEGSNMVRVGTTIFGARG